MRHFGHTGLRAYHITYPRDGGFIRATLNNCVVCLEELDHTDQEQIYAHHKCWKPLSIKDHSRIHDEIGPQLRNSQEGDAIDFTL